MAVTIKSEHEIALMRESCKRLAVVHDEIGKMIRPGISTWELDKKAYELIKELGGTPNFLHLYGYPATICASVNEVVVHGIPSKDKILKEGDIVGIDMGLIYKGYHSDAARTHAQAATWMKSVRPSRSMRNPSATAWSATWSDTGSEPNFMKIRKFRTTGGWAAEKESFYGRA